MHVRASRPRPVATTSLTSTAPASTGATTALSTGSTAHPPVPPSRAAALAWATGHDNVADLRPSVQVEIAKVAHLASGRRDVVEALKAVLDDPAMFAAKMTLADDNHLVQALWACVPVSATPAKAVDMRCAFVDAVTDGQTPVKNAIALVQQAWNSGADVVLAPEWLFVGDGAVMSAADHDRVLTTLCAMTRGSDRLCVPGTIAWADDTGRLHNTAWAISDGAVIHTIEKRGDGGDVDIAKLHALTYFSTEVQKPTFTWRGLTVGVEICRDHGDARLRRELAGRPRDVVDLQLIVSSGVWVKHPAVGVGGVVALAQGDASFGHEQFRRTAKGLEPL